MPLKTTIYELKKCAVEKLGLREKMRGRKARIATIISQN